MSTSLNSSLNLGLAATPNVRDPELYDALLTITNAIRTLAAGLDEYTQEGLIGTKADLTAAQTRAIVTNLHLQLVELQLQLIGVLRVIPWGTPGAIGDIAPNSVVATKLTATEEALLQKLTVTTNSLLNTLEVTGSTTLKSLTVNTDAAVVGKFAANGKLPSAAIELPVNATDPATSYALNNKMKEILITFGLGVDNAP